MKPEHRHPRQEDLSREPDWIRAFLGRGSVAVLAAVKGGLPTCLPRLYAFDSRRSCLYFQAGFGGEIGGLVEADGGAGVPVSLVVHEMGRFLPAERAAEFGVEYASVVVFGKAHLVREAAEAEHGLRLLMEKYAPHLEPGKDYAPFSREELEETAVHRVDIEIWSGKANQAPEGSPGAYAYGAVEGPER